MKMDDLGVYFMEQSHLEVDENVWGYPHDFGNLQISAMVKLPF